jgi:hypothetical protein
VDDLSWLAQWYLDQCNGDWEHEYGVTISTLDNPGWSIRIDLVNTELENVVFEGEEIQGDDEWIRFWKDEQTKAFHAAGSPMTLPSMVSRFRQWAESATD